MVKEKKKRNEGVVKSIFIAYSILILNVLVVAMVVVLVLLLQGLINNMIWVAAGFLAIFGLIGFAFYLRIKKERKDLTLNENRAFGNKYSFPSGHTASLLSFAIIFFYFKIGSGIGWSFGNNSLLRLSIGKLNGIYQCIC